MLIPFKAKKLDSKESNLTYVRVVHRALVPQVNPASFAAVGLDVNTGGAARCCGKNDVILIPQSHSHGSIL